MEIKIIRTEHPAPLPEGPLGFGKYHTDHMFVMEYSDGHWHDARIEPYHGFELDPASMVLHYAQETFEGLKAYHGVDGKSYLFRPEMNARRFQNSNKRMSMPIVPEEDFLEAVHALVKVDERWIPTGANETLYIRPFMFATEPAVGVHPANRFLFVIITLPVGTYYAGGLAPVRIYVEDEFTRATAGGTGFVKCGGNYAGSLAAQLKAEELGYDQVLWLDGMERKHVEEVGSMNVMFLVDGELYTAPVDGTVLPGVTRDSALELARSWNVPVHEEHFSIDWLMQMAREGKLQEAWGTGTAAIISPVGELYYKGEKVIINNNETGEFTQKIYDTLTGIQWGRDEDPRGWRVEV